MRALLALAHDWPVHDGPAAGMARTGPRGIVGGVETAMPAMPGDVRLRLACARHRGFGFARKSLCLRCRATFGFNWLELARAGTERRRLRGRRLPRRLRRIWFGYAVGWDRDRHKSDGGGGVVLAIITVITLF